VIEPVETRKTMWRPASSRLMNAAELQERLSRLGYCLTRNAKDMLGRRWSYRVSPALFGEWLRKWRHEFLH
jgi:hypothetical protein